MYNIIKGSQAADTIRHYDFPTKLEVIERARKGEEEHLHGKSFEKDILDKAMLQSEEILNNAKAEGEKIKKDAQEEGYQNGYKAGRKAGYSEAYKENNDEMEAARELAKTQVWEAIAEIEMQKQRLVEQYLEDLKNISISVAEKVIQVSLKSSGDIIKKMIVSATDKLKKTEWVKIYISKYDAELMLEGDAQLLSSLSYLSDNIKIITMDQEDRGTCIIELPDEIIDVSVNTQVENIKDILNNAHL